MPGIRYVPLGDGRTPAQRLPFDAGALEATGLVALCDVDDRPTGNTVPTLSIAITQFVQLSDGSLIRLDMDRGVTAGLHAVGFELAADAPVSWQRSADDLIAEVLDLVRADDPDDPTAHPWEDLAAAARLRGIEVDAAALARLPYRVIIGDTLARVSGF